MTDSQHVFRTPLGDPALMTYRLGTSDWNILWSGLNEDQYGFAALASVRRVLDVGAHIGTVSVGLALDHPECEVIALEPLPDNIRLLRLNAPRNVTVVWGAGAREATEVVIYHNYRGSEAAEHNAFVGNLRTEWDHDEIRVKGYPLSAFLPLDLIKIDCEGGEYAFLDTPDVAEVPLILGEWHNLGGAKTRADLLALLPDHDVTFTGPGAGPGGFRAVRRV